MSNPHETAAESLSHEFDHGNISQASRDRLGSDFVDYAAQSWSQLGEAMRQIPVEEAGLHDMVIRSLGAGGITRVKQSLGSRPQTSRITVLSATTVSLCALFVVALLTSSVSDDDLMRSSVWNTAQHEMLEHVRNTDRNEWQVVVVNVAEEHHARVRNKIRQSVVDKGMTVESMMPEDSLSTDNSPDVFISGGNTAIEVLRTLEQEIQNSDGDLQTSLPDDFDREELVSRFNESMRSPTESERFFGEMMVIHADAGLVTVSAAPITDAVAAADANQLRKAATENSMSVSPTVEVPPTISSGEQRPVLVVLVSKKAEMQGPQSNRSGRQIPELVFVAEITG